MENPTIYERLDNQFENMDTFERKFMLYKCLDWQRERLDKIIKESPEPENAKDAYDLLTMNNHKKIADEMVYVLIAELF